MSVSLSSVLARGLQKVARFVQPSSVEDGEVGEDKYDFELHDDFA
jgi:hypothetical protein